MSPEILPFKATTFSQHIFTMSRIFLHSVLKVFGRNNKSSSSAFRKYLSDVFCQKSVIIS